jgi:hypothetical protein
MFDEGLSRTKHVQMEYMWAVMNVFISVKVVYLQTDAQENCIKMNIKIYIETAPTCFGLTF